ncbi:PHD finger protein ING1-like [Chenopodium quinoa]|uniref:PHD finger protein ING n=1 Tax=Chenopodium quinoa TaxID=63459 RepID=A0A803M3P9_CHEQI|nr:PHD finger protein ING1-like [Chenopodium quinoa]XP_021732428.1 PHD finger protein ING1-like [Chenopodium quinoa]
MTSFLDEFQANLELLPNILQKKYALLRDLDKSLQGILRQNEQRCEQEIEDIKQRLLSGSITPESSGIRFSDEALDEQKHSVRIADEKVALAVQAYDLVDAHIQQLDQYLKTSEEENRREKELASAPASSDASGDGSTKTGRSSEGGRGGRKKTRLAAAAAAATAPANPPSMDLDIPVDPNEPTYCLCNQVSYGEMVACDNPDCRIEWFHFGCVSLKEKPKGKWYCSDCAGTQKRRKGK